MAAVANADPNELLPILLQAQPNKVRLGVKDELKYKEKLLAKARVIADSANRLWRKSSKRLIQTITSARSTDQPPRQKSKCGKNSRRSEQTSVVSVREEAIGARRLDY